MGTFLQTISSFLREGRVPFSALPPPPPFLPRYLEEFSSSQEPPHSLVRIATVSVLESQQHAPLPFRKGPSLSFPEPPRLSGTSFSDLQVFRFFSLLPFLSPSPFFLRCSPPLGLAPLGPRGVGCFPLHHPFVFLRAPSPPTLFFFLARKKPNVDLLSFQRSVLNRAAFQQEHGKSV